MTLLAYEHSGPEMTGCPVRVPVANMFTDFFVDWWRLFLDRRCGRFSFEDRKEHYLHVSISWKCPPLDIYKLMSPSVTCEPEGTLSAWLQFVGELIG